MATIHKTDSDSFYVGDEVALLTVTPQAVAAGTAQTTVEGRLTLATGTPVTTTDQTAKTTLHFTPYNGNRIALYASSAWAIYKFSELSIAIPATNYFRLYDVYCYLTSGAPALELLGWDSSRTTASVTGATNAAPVVVSLGAGFSNNDMAGARALAGNTSPNGRIWTLENAVAGGCTDPTNDLEGSSGNGTWTSGGTLYKIPTSRSTGLTLQDGVLVKSADATRRYLGTIMTTDVSGECEDSVTKRYVWNYYNRQRRRLIKLESTSSWTYSTATARVANLTIDNRVQFVVGVAEPCAEIVVTAKAKSSTEQDAQGFPYYDRAGNLSPDAETTQHTVTVVASGYVHWNSTLRTHPAIGYHYAAWLEKGAGSGTQTFYGAGRGIHGWIEG